jgi:hypothetical protein
MVKYLGDEAFSFSLFGLGGIGLLIIVTFLCKVDKK